MEDKAFDYSIKSRENFAELDKMIGKLVSQCNKKTLVNSKILNTVEDSDLQYRVPNAAAFQQFDVNGINIYAILNNQNKPIDFFISSNPVFKERQLESMGKILTLNDLKGTPFIEYSIGGQENGFEIGFKGHTPVRHFSIIAPDDRGVLENQLVMSSGYRLMYTIDFRDRDVADYSYGAKENAVKDKYLSGDLMSFLPDSKINQKEVITNLLEKIKSMTMEKSQEKAPEKVSFLKKLLGKNAELDKEIDAFKKNFSK